MNIEKKTVYGIKGKTLIYSIPNVRESENFLYWDSFLLYTPKGNLIDEGGFKYFEVPAGEVEFERDDTFNKIIIIAVEVNQEPIAYEIFEGESFQKSLGLEGDFILSIIIPVNPSDEIICQYIEVIEVIE